MVACEQKYCVNCVRPVFKDGKFLFGHCKARPLILYTSSEDDIEEEDSENDESTSGTLAGISQAVLNGSGLRSNEFVQNSIQQGYYISSMKYRNSIRQSCTTFGCRTADTRKDFAYGRKGNEVYKIN